MRNLAILLCSLILTASNLSAAGPIMHAYLSELLFARDHRYNEEQKKEFILGTLFPDIRYISNVERGDTHYEMITLQDVLNEPSPFIAGMKYHSWVDDERNTFVIDSRIYDKMHAKVKPRHRPTFLKIVEDEAVHKKVDWKRCCSYLETINEQEYNYGIDKKIVNQWHQILTLFFRSSPGSVLALLSVSNVDQKHLSPQDAQIWVNELEEKINMPLMHDYIDDMIKHFEKLLSSAPIQ